MAKPKKKVKKQKLSKKAASAKAARDKKRAMRSDRKSKKAENQRKRRAAKKKGRKIKGKDYDHKKKRFVSVKRTEGITEKELKKRKNDEIINILNIYTINNLHVSMWKSKMEKEEGNEGEKNRNEG